MSGQSIYVRQLPQRCHQQYVQNVNTDTEAMRTRCFRENGEPIGAIGLD